MCQRDNITDNILKAVKEIIMIINKALLLLLFSGEFMENI